MKTVHACWLAFAIAASLGIPRGTVAADAEDVSAKVARRMRDWQPTRDERLLDQVGWASGLVDAQRLAKQHQRPLFVFTYDGSATRANAIALQRC